MGKPMAHHLMKAGNRLTIFTKTKNKAKELIDAGAKWENSPKEAAKGQDFVCIMVGYPQDVEEVVFGEKGIIHTIKQGSILIDFKMKISLPGLALVHQLYVSVQALGAGYKGTQALYLALKNMAGMD